MTSQKMVEENTELLNNMSTHHLLPAWVGNFKENLKVIDESKDIMELEKKKEPAIVVGAGPSIKMHNHLKMLQESNFKGTIFATDRIL